MKKNIIVLLAILTCLLTACEEKAIETMESNPSATEILEEMDKVHEDMESVEVTFTEQFGKQRDEGIEKYDYTNEIAFLQSTGVGLIMFKDKDGFVLSFDGETEAAEDTENEIFELKFENQTKQQKNQLAYLRQFDTDLYEKFDLEDGDDRYILTYTGNEEDQLLIIEGYALDALSRMELVTGEGANLSDTTVDKLDIKVTVNKETHYMESFEWDIKYFMTINGKKLGYDLNVIYEYSNYNQVTIEKPNLEVATESFDNSGDPSSLTEEQKETYEKEAMAYVDALIQATVFQNEKEYMNRVPGLLSDDEKMQVGEQQKQIFYQIYVQNTTANMAGSGVTDEEVLALTDAFMNALSKTKYEVIEANAQSEEEIKVSLSVEGIDDTGVYSTVNEQLMALLESGEVTEEDAVSKNIELLVKNYSEIDSLLDPLSLDVYVIRNDDGSYMVLLQDQYLAGFVQ